MTQFDNTYSGDRINDIRALEEERFVQAMAPKLGFDYVNLRGYTINPEALTATSEQKAVQGGFVCFDLKQNTVLVAAKNPNDPKVQTAMNELMGLRYTIQMYMCSQQSLEHAWERYKDVVSTKVEKKGVLEISPEDILRMRQEIKVKEDIPKILASISGNNNTRRISATLELIFAGASEPIRIVAGTHFIHALGQGANGCRNAPTQHVGNNSNRNQCHQYQDG